MSGCIISLSIRGNKSFLAVVRVKCRDTCSFLMVECGSVAARACFVVVAEMTKAKGRPALPPIVEVRSSEK